MKKIINGKMYNTETAKCVGAWHNGHYTTDIYYVSEDLYQKNNGEFFLYGEGGPMSRYSKRSGENWGGGEDIIPLSYKEAQEWAEKRLDADDYEKIFGEIPEDDTKKVVTFSLSVTTVEKLKRLASQNNTGLSEYVETLINSAL